MSITERCIEWANMKCKYSTYFGYVPDWVTAIEIPTWEQINRFEKQIQRALPLSLAKQTMRSHERSTRRGANPG